MAALPSEPAATSAYYLIGAVYTREQADAVNAALYRDLFGLLARGGVYLTTISLPRYKALLEACGFRPFALPGHHNPWTDEATGYVLDLTRIGVDAWLDSLVTGHQPEPPLPPAELLRAAREALQHWDDDTWLARSPLLRLPLVLARTYAEPDAATLRAVLQGVIAREREQTTPPADLPWRALERVYLQRGAKRTEVARQLAVSRAHLYRLLDAGIARLTERLGRHI